MTTNSKSIIYKKARLAEVNSMISELQDQLRTEKVQADWFLQAAIENQMQLLRFYVKQMKEEIDDQLLGLS